MVYELSWAKSSVPHVINLTLSLFHSFTRTDSPTEKVSHRGAPLLKSNNQQSIPTRRNGRIMGNVGYEYNSPSKHFRFKPLQISVIEQESHLYL